MCPCESEMFPGESPAPKALPCYIIMGPFKEPMRK